MANTITGSLRAFASYMALLVIVISAMAAPPEGRLPPWLTIASAALFFVAQTAHPGLRFSNPMFSPRNFALSLACLQLVVFPTVINQSDILFKGTLPFDPGDGAILEALMLQMVAFGGLCVGLLLNGRWSGAEKSDSLKVRRLGPLIALGLVGVVLRFRSLANLVNYLRGGGQDLPTDLGGTVSSFLLPCLSFGLFVLALRQAGKCGGRLSARVVAVLLLAIVAGSLFSYNRSAAIVPLACWFGVYAQRVRPVRRLGGVVLITALVAAVLLVTQFRTISHREELRSIGVSTGEFSGYSLGLNELQLYGAAPQFLAFGLGITPPVRHGQVTLNGALSSIPILGKGSREASGTRIFNRGVYGVTSATVDQTLPATLEFYWDFGPAGVLLGFILVGALVGLCQRRYVSAKSDAHAFVWAFFGFWSAALLILQVETFVQIMVFWSVPVFLLLHGPEASSGQTGLGAAFHPDTAGKISPRILPGEPGVSVR